MSSTLSTKDAVDDAPKGDEPHFTPLSIIIAEILWNIFDTLVLFRLGTIYLHRFEDFAHCGNEDHDEDDDTEVSLWRTAQQEEWTMLSTSVSRLSDLPSSPRVYPQPWSVISLRYLGP